MRRIDFHTVCSIRRPGGMLAVGFGGGVVLFDAEIGEGMWEVKPRDPMYACPRVAMSPDGKFVAGVGLDDGQWTIWEAAGWSGTVHRSGVTHTGRNVEFSHAVAFSPCGQTLATGGGDGVVVLWDAQTGEAKHHLQGNSGGVNSVSFSACGVRLACGNIDGSIRVWETRLGALLRTMTGGGRSSVVQFSPTESRTLASAGEEDHIHLWDVNRGEKMRSIRGSRFAAFSPDGCTIATAGLIDPSGINGDEVHVVDAESGALRRTLAGHTGLCAASFSIDGSRIASGGLDGTCKTWESSTGTLLRTFHFSNPNIHSVAWGRDWERDARRAFAFAMGQHPRLGAGSQVLELEEGVVRMILDRVWWSGPPRT